MENTTFYLDDELTDNPAIFFPGEGEVLALGGGKVTLKVTSNLTNDQLGVYEILLPPGSVGAQLHYHRFMDETFIVNKGTLSIQLAGREVEAPEGSVVYVPRFTPHGFSNQSANEVTLTLIFNPGQNREGFFRGMKEILSEQPVDESKFLKLYNKYDSFPADANNMLPRIK
jgi:quercetin dioxygenase-like cupin family protein